MTPSTAKRALVALAAATALAASAGCTLDSLTAEGEASPLDTSETAPWQPSEEWLMLRSWAEEVATLRAEALDEDDRDRQLERYEQYRQEKTALEDYLIAHPDADAPCDVRYSYAPPELWPDGPCPAD